MIQGPRVIPDPLPPKSWSGKAWNSLAPYVFGYVYFWRSTDYPAIEMQAQSALGAPWRMRALMMALRLVKRCGSVQSPHDALPSKAMLKGHARQFALTCGTEPESLESQIFMQ